jgi:hypothetical protein
MNWLTLQTELDCYTSSGDRLSCVFEDWAVATGGETVFGFLLAAALLFGLYQASETLIVPAVILTLFAGFLVPLLPGPAAGIAGSVVIVAFAVAVFAALRRYSLQGVR